MGFLDHSTNNIIVDAVLTDYGRQKLAELGGGGAGDLVKNYAFADTEVDYSMITKYGVIVGKEKIEKNTPIFEASTTANSGIHTMLYTTEDPTAQQAATTANVTPATLTKGVTERTTLRIQTEDPSDQLQNVTYLVKFDSRFLNFTNTGAGRIDGGVVKTITIDNAGLNVNLEFKLNQNGNVFLSGNTGFTFLNVTNVNTGAVLGQIQVNLNYQ